MNECKHVQYEKYRIMECITRSSLLRSQCSNWNSRALFCPLYVCMYVWYVISECLMYVCCMNICMYVSRVSWKVWLLWLWLPCQMRSLSSAALPEEETSPDACMYVCMYIRIGISCLYLHTHTYVFLGLSDFICLRYGHSRQGHFIHLYIHTYILIPCIHLI